jgi:predicted nucleotidyltransferase
MNRDYLKEKIAKFFRDIEAAELVYLFGSFLSRDDCSDIDVGVLFEEHAFQDGGGSVSELDLEGRLEKALGYRKTVDLKLLRGMPVDFLHEVVKEGQIVFCRSELERVEFETRILEEYLDFRETSLFLDKKFLEKVKNG